MSDGGKYLFQEYKMRTELRTRAERMLKKTQNCPRGGQHINYNRPNITLKGLKIQQYLT